MLPDHVEVEGLRATADCDEDLREEVCDELIDRDRVPEDLHVRFAVARETASVHGVHLIDWIACDDDCFRSTRLALGADPDEWWDAPTVDV